MTDIHAAEHDHHPTDSGGNAVLWIVSLLILAAVVIWLATAMNSRDTETTTPPANNNTTIQIPGVGTNSPTTTNAPSPTETQ
jgi:hypothetical protein